MRTKLQKVKHSLYLAACLFGSNQIYQAQTFNFTGGVQSYTVPPLVTVLNVTVSGAQGGGSGGLGATYTSTMGVTPGQVLQIYVGGAGTNTNGVNTGGFNGGGGENGNYGNEGSGGGASDIRTTPYALANRVIVAGGGGGQGGYAGGNGGAGGLLGLVGGAGQPPCTGGNGGTASSGGTGGLPNGACGSGSAGSLGIGGAGGACSYGGGGGGGGYYGGGGGGSDSDPCCADAAGGGGGSSFNSFAGGVCTDGVKTGNGIVIIQAVLPGEALNFDGVNDYVNVGSALTTTFSGTNKITVEAWVKPETNTGLGIIAGNYGTFGTNLQYLLRRDNNNYVFFVNNGSGFNNVTSIATVTVNAWTHVAATYDGSAIRMYVNGVASGTLAYTGNLMAYTDPVFIGGRLTGEYFDGDIDEVRIWNKVLCQAEIQNNMNGQIPVQPNLVGYYQFNQGIAGANNSSSFSVTAMAGSTGTAVNMPLTTGTVSNWVAPGGVVSGSTVMPFVSPTIAVSGVNSICSGSSATFTASGVSTYSWTSGPNTATYAVTPSVTTTYSVVGTATNGCLSNMATKSITVNATPTVAINNNSVCGTGVTSLTVTATGGSPFTYAWSTGATTSVITNAVPGVYTSTVTNTNGCFTSSSGTITSSPTPTITVNSGAVCTGNAFTITPSGASTYTYSGGSAVVSPTATSAYTVSGTNTVGCVGNAVSNVTVNANPTITVNSGAVCSGASFTMVPSGASTYTFQGGSAVKNPTANASYTVTGTSAAGCVGNVATSNVTVNANPTVTAVSNQTNFICSGQSANLTASGASTYSWSNSSTGANISVSPTVTTSYTVMGTDANGCMANAVVSQSVSACTGIAINVSNKNTEVKLFPNPTNGILNIELGNIENTSLVITNALGQVVLTEKVTNELSSLNIQGLSNGIYFVQVVNNNKVVNTQKIIKQ